MIFNWFKIFNMAEFLATGLVSRVYQLELEGVGVKDILVTHGNTVAITYEDTMLAVNLNGKNPFVFEQRAVYVDENSDVYLGFLIT